MTTDAVRPNRAPTGRYRSHRLAERAARIRTEHRARYAGAQTTLTRLAYALDYARSAAAAADRAGMTEEADAALAEATRALLAVGDTVTAELAERAKKGSRT